MQVGVEAALQTGTMEGNICISATTWTVFWGLHNVKMFRLQFFD